MEQAYVPAALTIGMYLIELKEIINHTVNERRECVFSLVASLHISLKNILTAEAISQNTLKNFSIGGKTVVVSYLSLTGRYTLPTALTSC